MKLASHFLSLIFVATLCGNSPAENISLPNDKVVLEVSLQEKLRLITRLGFTNVVTDGTVWRDCKGTRLFFSVETGMHNNPVQQLRTQQLVVVTAYGVHINPWHFPANERVTDDEKLAVWQDPTRNFTWQVRSGEWLPKGCNVEDISGNWIAITESNRAPWIAKLDTPTNVAAELPNFSSFISIFASGDTVHVFARRGWHNDEGPMKYLIYDFTKTNSQPVKETNIAWARCALDMDPETGFAVLNDNNNFWGRTWLLNLNTGKRKWISISDWTLIVDKNVAQKWIELTKPN